MKIRETIQEHMFAHILALCQIELELDNLPEIEFVDTPYIENGNKRSFGEFDGQRIRIVTRSRHIIDINRTISHELTHWKQMTMGMDMDGGDGSETENQANAIAGIVLRRFAEKYPDYFINSLP